ncbi:MAG: MATE family efflux transporter, partial [Saprospiraceae bacterium]|nr:MATE family efflux transporter [Saprospiraceae bacterium]
QLMMKLALKTSMALGQWGHFLRVNSDIFLRTLCLSFTFAFFYRQSSDQGAYILAVNTVLLQFLNWMSFGIDGFAYAAESLVGKYKGAAQKEKWNRALNLCFMWGMALAGLYTIVYGIWGEDLLAVFSDKPEVINEGKKYLFWFCLLPILATPSYIWDGVFVGLTASKAMRNSMFIALVFFVGTYFVMENYWANHALWLALLVFLFMRGLIQTVMYRRGLTT